MKLAVSQIAWSAGDEPAALALLRQHGFAGVEIAPPRLAGPEPYEAPEKAAAYRAEVLEGYGLTVCSMQSIWYGRQGSMFGPERPQLLEYTKKAIRFAAAGGIGSLVFGNPKNRAYPETMKVETAQESAVAFFREVGEEAVRQGTVVSLEANPPLYGTNFMNTTPEAFAMMRRVGCPGCRVNLDFGTMVINGEKAASLAGLVLGIRHVHISEPELAMLQPRPEHRELAELLRTEGYEGYVSIEMKQQPLAEVERAVNYLAEVFA